MRLRLNILHLLVIANAILLLAAAGVGWDMTRRYGELVYGFNARNAQKIADVGITDLAWREYAQFVSEVARHVAQGEQLRKLTGERNGSTIKTALEDEFGRGAISSGQVKVLGLSVYDAEMGLLGEAWRGAPAAIPAALNETIKKRTGSDRLKIIWRVWQHNDEPRLTAFAPVGGLRLAGYVAVHADPIHALATLDHRLGMAVEIASLGGRVLLASDSFKIPDGAAVRQTVLSAHDPDGTAIARLKVTQDVTDLRQALDLTALWSLATFVVICGGIAAGAISFVALHMRQVRRRETEAQSELEKERREKAESDQARRAADQQAETIRRRELLRLADGFEANVKSVVESVSARSSETAENSETLTTAAQRASDLAGAAADASEHAFATVEAVAKAAQALSHSTAEMTAQVTQSSTIAGKAVAEANNTNRTMRDLAEAAQKIGEIIDLIKTIAGQTNLLALNATIEAARAGEAGRGFAVVAAEVKSLATQTAKATEEITVQVNTIQTSTRSAASAIEVVGRTIDEISGIADHVTAAIEKQAAATNEIVQNVEAATSGARGVAANIAGARQAAAENGDVAGVVRSASRELAQQAESLHHEVERFLSTVRAA